MYNAELKNRFLETYSDKTSKTYKDSLMQISESEEARGKDIFSFNYEQLDNAFKSIRTKTLSGARRIISPVLEYIRWANQNGFVKSKIDITNLFMGDKLKNYVWKHAQDNSYIGREEVYELCEYLANDVDKAVLILAFEGIDGREHFDMLNLKYTDINFATGKVKVVNINGEIREVIIEHQQSLDILKASEQQVSYMLSNGDSPNSRKKEYDLVDTPYVVRKIERKNDSGENDEVATVGFLLAKVTRFFKGKRNITTGELVEEPFLSDCEFLNLTNLFKSGYFDYCMTMEKEYGELQTGHFRDACLRFGVNPKNLQSYKAQYLDWKINSMSC